jgi:predicted MFS family arabinose efflux permease
MQGRKLAILTAGNFFVATSFMSVTGLLNEISAGLQLDVRQAGNLIAVFAITAGICAPILATFGSRIDRRKLLTVSLAIAAVANMLGAFCETYGQLMAVRIAGAIASAVYTPQVAATVSMLIDEKERGPVLAKLMMGWAIGAVIGGPLTVIIGSYFGWRVSFAVIGLGGVIISTMIWRTVPVGVKVPPLNLQRWIDIAKHPVLVLLTLTTLLNAAGNHFVFSYMAPTMLELHNAKGLLISVLIAVNGLGGVAGSLLAVRVIPHLGAPRVAYLATSLVVVVFLFWPLLAPFLVLIFIMQFFWSAGIAGFPAVQQTRFVAIAPTMASATIALNSSVGYLGNSIGTKLGGYAWEWVGARYLPWLAMLLMAASVGFSVLSERSAQKLASKEKLGEGDAGK